MFLHIYLSVLLFFSISFISIFSLLRDFEKNMKNLRKKADKNMKKQFSTNIGEKTGEMLCVNR